MLISAQGVARFGEGGWEVLQGHSLQWFGRIRKGGLSRLSQVVGGQMQARAKQCSKATDSLGAEGSCAAADGKAVESGMNDF